MNNPIYLSLLKETHLPVHWLPGQLNDKKDSRIYYAYFEDTDAENILDDICTPGNWSMNVKEINGRTYCGIGIRTDNGLSWRFDTGREPVEGSKADPITATFTSGFKRTCLRWGIGRDIKMMNNEYLDWNLLKKCPVVNGKDLKSWEVDDAINSRIAKRPGDKKRPVKTIVKKEVIADLILTLVGGDVEQARAKLTTYTKDAGTAERVTLPKMSTGDVDILWNFIKEKFVRAEMENEGG